MNRNSGRLIICRRLVALLFILTGVLSGCARSQPPAGAILLLQAHGEVNSVMAGYLSRGIAAGQQAPAIVIELDTPGGLDSSMRQIIQRMNSSTIPIIVYVAPTGARAASAGTFITEAASLAAMAPGTNIGAASPVGSGGSEISGTEGKKVTNDAAAFIRSLAQEHGRNADWAESAVREATALPASEAKAQNVVDLIAPDLTSLLQQADGRPVRAAGATVTLHTSDAGVYTRDLGLAERILDLISDPNIAFLLFTLGGLALAFEVVHPTLFSGAFGLILLVTGLFALGTLPTNWAGAALILLAFGLLVADVYSGGVLVLAAGGITSLVIGGLLLVGGSGAAPEVSRWLVFGTAAVIALLFLGAVSALFRTRRRPPAVGETTLLGREAVVRSRLDPTGYVSIDGENWKATIDRDDAEPGERVKIVGVRGLELDVRHADPEVIDKGRDVSEAGPVTL
jgi:membrane-bound serine protease (ClpP class)